MPVSSTDPKPDIIITNETSALPTGKDGVPAIIQLVGGGKRQGTALEGAKIGQFQGSIAGVVWHTVALISDQGIERVPFLPPLMRTDGDSVIHVKFLG